MSATAPTFDPISHSYAIGGKPLIAVSRVIDAVLKKSFDGVDPAVLANAAERGQRTEDYCTTILETGRVEIPAGERQDVIERVRCFWKFYQQGRPKILAKQLMVWDEEDGIAGKLDWLLWFPREKTCVLTDCKCTSQAEKSWALQVGAYASYCPDHYSVDATAILHINPSFAQGYIWRLYNLELAVQQWKSALNWYRTLEQLNA